MQAKHNQLKLISICRYTLYWRTEPYRLWRKHHVRQDPGYRLQNLKKKRLLVKLFACMIICMREPIVTCCMDLQRISPWTFLISAPNPCGWLLYSIFARPPSYSSFSRPRGHRCPILLGGPFLRIASAPRLRIVASSPRFHPGGALSAQGHKKHWHF